MLIRLQDSTISVTQLERISDIFKNCKSLSNIDLSRSKIKDEHIECITHLLNENESIAFILLTANDISDTGIEIMSQSLAGNTSLHTCAFYNNNRLTEKSIPFFIEIAKTTYINVIQTPLLNNSYAHIQEINTYLRVPREQREIPIKSKTKSAAKSSYS